MKKTIWALLLWGVWAGFLELGLHPLDNQILRILISFVGSLSCLLFFKHIEKTLLKLFYFPSRKAYINIGFCIICMCMLASMTVCVVASLAVPKLIFTDSFWSNFISFSFVVLVVTTALSIFMIYDVCVLIIYYKVMLIRYRDRPFIVFLGGFLLGIIPVILLFPSFILTLPMLFFVNTAIFIDVRNLLKSVVG